MNNQFDHLLIHQTQQTTKRYMNNQFDHLAESICEDFGVSLDDVKSNKKPQHIVDVRHIVAYCLFKNFSTSLKQVGDYLNRDHSTIIHSIRKVNSLEDLRAYASAKLDTHIPDVEYLNIIRSMDPDHPMGNVITYV
jgi:chromosomal replication initiation ATPase DnaA